MKKILLSVILACSCITGLFAQGTVDPAFGDNGLVNIPGITGFSEISQVVTVQDDGKILVAGQGSPSMLLKRYNENGTLDSSFGNQGVVSAFIATQSISDITGITVQPDGKILLCGYLGSKHLFIMRFNNNGTPDVNFANNGILSYYPGDATPTALLYPENVTVLSDNKIMIAGRLDNISFGTLGLFAVKFNADGTPDVTYGYNGYFAELSGGYTESAVIYPDGKTAFAILTYNTSAQFTFTTIKRYDQTGVLDTSFGINGATQITNGTLTYGIRELIIQADGKLVGGGIASLGENLGADFTVMRLNDDGTPDTTFGIDGKTIPFNPGSEEIGKIAIQPNGGIIGLGFDGVSNGFYMCRFSSSGMQDMNFGVNGIAKITFGDFQHVIYDMVTQSDGKIIVTGWVAFPEQTINNFMIMRFLGDDVASLNDNTLSQISLYPNPTSLTLTLADAQNITIENLTVTDMTGKLVLSQKGSNPEINVEVLPQGIYFLNVSTQEGIQHLKFVKE